jgi:hypothetical protein
MNVLVIKDEEGILRPQAGIWEAASESYIRAVQEEWDNSLIKKKHFKGCTLVPATLTESN